MRYYRDVDYFLYFMDFPHMGVYGAAVSNTDGTVNIYINTLYNTNIQERTIRHELRHMAKGHLWDDTKPITQKELEADEPDGCIFGEGFAYVEFEFSPAFVNVWMDAPNDFIPSFSDLGALLRYEMRLKEHYAKKQKSRPVRPASR